MKTVRGRHAAVLLLGNINECVARLLSVVHSNSDESLHSLPDEAQCRLGGAM